MLMKLTLFRFSTSHRTSHSRQRVTARAARTALMLERARGFSQVKPSVARLKSALQGGDWRLAKSSVSLAFATNKYLEASDV